MDLSGKESARVTIIGIIINLLLAILKGTAGILANSAVMVADAGHSLSDLISDGVTLWALYIARRPKDKDHPYGHGKFETLGTLIIATLLTMAGIGLALNSFNHLGNLIIPGRLAMIMAIVSILFKEFLYQYSVRIAKKNNSRILLANAWHHRSDAISSIVALIGIAGAMLGYPVLDPIAAILVSGWIIKTGITIGYEAVEELTDTRVEKSILLSIGKTLHNTEGVEHFHRIRARRMGPYILVDLHIKVNSSISVSVAHQVAERVRLAVLEEIPAVNEVLVHVDPEDIQEEVKANLMRPQKEIEKEIRQVLNEIPEIESTSHVMCHFLEKNISVQIDIVVDPKIYVFEAAKIAKKAQVKVEKISDIHSADIHLELESHQS